MSKNSMFTKAAAGAAGLAMAFSAALPAGAVTIAELQAQIAALMAQLSSLQGGSTTATVTFTRDLTVGSSGADVTALQQTLVAQGYLTMPAGTAFGYFGTLTKSAVARWQAAVGLPATGYFGTLSRAKIGASATGGTTTGGTTTGGTTTGGVTGTITTPGAEGTLTITAAPVSNNTLYEGESMDPIVAFNAKATGSDIALQRVRVNLGTNTNLYNKVFQTLYVRDDAGRTLASVDMNSTNVVKDTDGTYYVTLSGFSSVIPKGAQRTYNVAASIRSSVDATYRTTYTTVNIPANGVRGVDGAGIDLYGPSSALTSNFTIANSLASSAQLTVSADASNPAAQSVVANKGSNNDQLDKLPVLVFDVKADKDNITITDINNVTITKSGQATASTTYLYVGNGTSGQLLGSAASTGSTTSFNNISYTIPKGSTAVFTIAADIRNAAQTATTISASFTANQTNLVGTNSIGDTVTNVSGSAQGNTMTVFSQGPQITLASKSITKSTNSATGVGTLQATFNVTVSAVGGDVNLGNTGAFDAAVYLANGATTTPNATTYSIPSSGVVTGACSGNCFTIQQGNSVTIPVTVIYSSSSTPSTYAVGLEDVKWGTGSNYNNMMASFMKGRTEWRTDVVVLP